MDYKHISVLLNESIEALNIEAMPNGIYLDGTLGGGGHSLEILKRLGEKGQLLGIDRDTYALTKAGMALSEHFGKYMLVHGNFSEFTEISDRLSINSISGAILDLGVSSFQLDDGTRGFSYMSNAPLDMRMDSDDKISAYNVVNNYDEKHLSSIIFSYGEERWAKRIAEFIAKERKTKPIETTLELVTIIKKAIPKSARENGPHPAKRTFQAIRIEVNHELEVLENAISAIVEKLEPGGRISIISFHSLEDRIIKNTFRKLEQPCTCPTDFPRCMCQKTPKLNVLTKKPILPSDEELEINPRARSAKLRVGVRI